MKRWWILKDRLRQGPYSEAELSELIKVGRFDANDFVTTEDAKGSVQTSHRTIREVLGHLAFEPSVAKVSPVVEVERRNPETRPDDVDGMPGIRDLIAKIEAVELVDSADRSEDTGLQFPPVHHSKAKDIADSVLDLFRRGAPAFGVLVVMGLTYAFFTREGDFSVGDLGSREPAAASESPRPKAPISTRATQGAPKVSVPKISERATQGFEQKQVAGPEIEQRNLREDILEVTEPESSRSADREESTPERGISARRERIRKLRNSMAPETMPGQEPVAGVAEGGNEEQDDYDKSREPAMESSADGSGSDESDEPPSVVEGDQDILPSEDTRGDVDENVDVEYQE